MMPHASAANAKPPTFGAVTLLPDTRSHRSKHRLPPLDHEGALYGAEGILLDEDTERSLLHEMEFPGLVTSQTNELIFASIQHFWFRMQQGSHPDIALCELVSDRLVSEMTHRVDQLMYLSQLRIRDGFTYSHTLDVCALSVALAIHAGFSIKEVREIGLASILHDMGKLLIPKPIMFKPTKLTDTEFEVMKLHPALGYNIIVKELGLPEQIGRPALEHQEMYSGGGYPQNLSKDEIHPYSHIVKIADVYDALTSQRPYKGVISSAKAIDIMKADGSRSFHPELFASFLKLANHS